MRRPTRRNGLPHVSLVAATVAGPAELGHRSRRNGQGEHAIPAPAGRLASVSVPAHPRALIPRIGPMSDRQTARPAPGQAAVPLYPSHAAEFRYASPRVVHEAGDTP